MIYLYYYFIMSVARYGMLIIYVIAGVSSSVCFGVFMHVFDLGFPASFGLFCTIFTTLTAGMIGWYSQSRQAKTMAEAINMSNFPREATNSMVKTLRGTLDLSSFNDKVEKDAKKIINTPIIKPAPKNREKE